MVIAIRFMSAALAAGALLLAPRLGATELRYRLAYSSSETRGFNSANQSVLLSSGLDLDGDGRLDLISDLHLNDTTVGPMRVYLGIGEGRFRKTSIPFWTTDRFAIGNSFLTGGDFDTDGRSDLALVDNGTRVLQVLGNVGAGNFRYRQTLTPPNPAPYIRINAIATGDFNGDSRPDLAALDRYIDPSNTADGSNPSGLVAWGQPANIALTGNPFDAGQSRFPTVPSAMFMATADFSRDGKTDLLVANRYGQAGLTLCNGNGVCNLQTSLNFDTSTASARSYATGVTAGDLNGDGFVDALIAYFHAGSGEFRMRVLRNNGLATVLELDPAIQVMPGGCGEVGISTPRIGDFNNDGKNDILLHCHAFGVPFFIAYGKGDFNFDPPATFDFSATEPGIRAVGLVRGDYNGDGKLDIAVQTDEGLRIFVHDPAFDRLFANGFQ